MKTSKTKELLILLRDFLPTNINKENGGSLCWSACDMWPANIISARDRIFIIEYLASKKPIDAGDFSTPDGNDTGFWWPYGELAPRMEFLNKLISEL